MTSTCKRAFTIIELLVVMGIITILMAAMSFSINSAQERARIQKATVEVKSISQAILAFEHFSDDYTLPVINEPTEANAQNLNFLFAQKKTSREVPVLIRAALATGNVINDPWGTPYKFTIRRGVITAPSVGEIRTGFSVPNFHRLSVSERQ